MDRTTIVKGPAIITYNSVTFYSKDSITFKPDVKTYEIQSGVHGKVDERIDDVTMEITFTPVGNPTAFTTLWPYQNPVTGSSIFGATDKNLVIQTLAGQSITIKNAAVTKMPDIILSSTKTIMGSMTFSAIGQNNLAWTDAAKRMSVAATSFSDASFAPSGIITQAYTVAWGSASPWNAIATEDGVTISSTLKTSAIKTDTDGVVDLILDSVDVTARMIPVGVSETQLVTLLKCQGAGIVRGGSLGALNTGALVVTGTGVVARIASASPRSTPMTFDRSKNRAGEIEFVANRTFSAGVAQALFSIAAA